MSLDLTDIPQIMRNVGWWKGQRLMEEWFSRPSAVAPNYSKPVDDVVTIDWALSFDRAKKIYDKLMVGRIWANHAAKEEIGKMLDRQGFLGDFQGTQTFGDLSRPVPLLDPDYINFRAVGDDGYAGYGYKVYDVIYPDLDDMTAALGVFVFRVVVAGTVRPFLDDGWVRYEVTISEVGVYIRDSYDFQGNQFLGYWDTPDYVAAWHWRFWRGEQVQNADFRNWRGQKGKGGDFLVYSDLRRTVLDRPDTFYVWASGRVTDTPEF